MPRQRITKDMVVNVAFEIARRDGIEKVMVKSIAAELGCSVQPIYSYCNNMDGLREDVGRKARNFVSEYIISHMDKADLFRSTGRAASFEYADLHDRPWHNFLCVFSRNTHR